MGKQNSESAQMAETLQARGVIIHAPTSTVFEDVDPERIEAGAEIYPGCVIRGPETLLRAGSAIGHSGGGLFENTVVGRGTALYGGVFKDAVFLDGVTVRGNAEMRGGTVMEEGSEVAHHVGLKMTILMSDVVMGSLVNFCDALVAGGTSRKDHSEVGSCLALYNFTPWGDKFASMFGDVPRGVFLASRRIFVGGQTQIVSPVKVGYGALIPAGCAVRRSIPENRMVGHQTLSVDTEFDHRLYGGLTPKFSLTREYVGNLRALLAWYAAVRLPSTRNDPLATACLRAAMIQIQAGIDERIKRLDKIIGKLPESLSIHRELLGEDQRELHQRRIAEHETVLASWPSWRRAMTTDRTLDADFLADIRTEMIRARAQGQDHRAAVRGLSAAHVDAGRQTLQDIVDGTMG